MSREDFRQRVLEQQIFNEVKDGSICNINYIKWKYQGLNINYSRLYRRIINYQIKIYGRSLNDRYNTIENYENRIRNRKRKKVNK